MEVKTLDAPEVPLTERRGRRALKRWLAVMMRDSSGIFMVVGGAKRRARMSMMAIRAGARTDAPDVDAASFAGEYVKTGAKMSIARRTDPSL